MNKKKWVIGQWYHLNSARRAQHSSNNGYIPVTNFWKMLRRSYTCPIFKVYSVDPKDNSVRVIQIPTEDGSFSLKYVTIDEKWLDYVRPFVPSKTSIAGISDIRNLLRDDVTYYADSATIDVLLQLGTLKNTYKLTSLRCFLNSGSGDQSTANMIRFVSFENHDMGYSCEIFGHHNQHFTVTPCVREFKDQILPWWIGLLLYKTNRKYNVDDIPENDEVGAEKQKIIEATKDMLIPQSTNHLVSAQDKKLLDAVKYLIAASGYHSPKDAWRLHIHEGEYNRGHATEINIIETADKRREQISTCINQLRSDIEHDTEKLNILLDL